MAFLVKFRIKEVNLRGHQGEKG